VRGVDRVGVHKMQSQFSRKKTVGDRARDVPKNGDECFVNKEIGCTAPSSE